MAADDNETTPMTPRKGTRGRPDAASGANARSLRPSSSSSLSPKVLRALARAREAAKADHDRKSGRWLAIFPVGVGVILLLLMMPRATTPDAVPLPQVDERIVADLARADDERARSAEEERLPTDILAVGSAVRALQGADARGLDEAGVADARRALDGALRDVARRPEVADGLARLRALQLRRFLDALTRWESTGETSDDFVDLAASFVQRASDAGWLRGRQIVPGETERRVMFKTVWNALTAVDAEPALAVTLDEQRALYRFYIRNPRPAESRRLALETQRQTATTPEACARANVEQARQTELWRADKIKRLGAIDPTYPTGYALGVAYWRAGRFDLSAESFTAFVGEHPDGPYALRARNHLKAALAASGSL